MSKKQNKIEITGIHLRCLKLLDNDNWKKEKEFLKTNNELKIK